MMGTESRSTRPVGGLVRPHPVRTGRQRDGGPRAGCRGGRRLTHQIMTDQPMSVSRIGLR